MIATRPDWCISRQRLWGVPIPAFYCKGCGEILLRADLARHVAGLFEAETADAWYAREAKDLLPAGFACPKCGGRGLRQGDRHPRRLVRLGLLARGRPRAAGRPALAGRRLPRGQRPAPRLVPLVAPHRRRDPRPRALPPGDHPRLHRGRRGQEDLEEPRQRRRHPEAHQHLRRRGPAAVDHHGRLPRGHADLRRHDQAGGGGLPQGPQHDPLPASPTSTTSIPPGTRWPRRPSTSSTATPSHRHRQVVARVLDAYDSLRVPPRLPPARAVRGGRPLLLLPRRAEGPALLRRGGRARGAAPPRPCSTGSPGTCASCWPPSSPSPPTRPGPSSPAARSPPCTSPSSPPRETADEALLSRWAGLLDVRAEVTKALEEARAAKQLAASLEAAVVLRGPARRARAAAGPRGEEPRLPGQPRQPVHRERRAPGGGRGAARASRSSTPRARSASGAGRGRRESERWPSTPASASAARRSWPTREETPAAPPADGRDRPPRPGDEGARRPLARRCTSTSPWWTAC